jgi:hypothetical protein
VAAAMTWVARPVGYEPGAIASGTEFGFVVYPARGKVPGGRLMAADGYCTGRNTNRAETVIRCLPAATGGRAAQAAFGFGQARCLAAARF